MIQKIFTLIFLSLVTNFGFASDNPIPPDSSVSVVNRTSAAYLVEEGRALFAQGKFKDGLIKFRQASIKDPSSWKAPYWVSRCHYEMDNYGYALKYAKEAIVLNDNEIEKDVYNLLANSFHRLGMIDSAIVYYERSMTKLTKMRAAELNLPLKLEQCQFAKAEMIAGKKPMRKRLTGSVNTGYNDYGAVIYDGGKSMYFTSRRENTTGGGQNPSDQQFFEDIYRATWDAEMNEWDSITNELGKINSTGFESISHISDDGLVALITLNMEAANNEKIKTKSSDIAEINWTTQERWSAPKIIKNKSINTSFFDSGATLTADGNTMYFVSEKNAEKSKSDIYVVNRIGKKWGEATRLPDVINSKERETTPFISPDGKYLFFSSNGFVGMGEYDIYVSENLGGGSWSAPKNLGATINTVNNDTHFKVYDNLKKAYYSGLEIVGDKASMDIYELSTTIDSLVK
jgi:tetratricopeptide (TPR) repeat protein